MKIGQNVGKSGKILMRVKCASYSQLFPGTSTNDARASYPAKHWSHKSARHLQKTRARNLRSDTRGLPEAHAQPEIWRKTPNQHGSHHIVIEGLPVHSICQYIWSHYANIFGLVRSCQYIWSHYLRCPPRILSLTSGVPNYFCIGVCDNKFFRKIDSFFLSIFFSSGE